MSDIHGAIGDAREILANVVGKVVVRFVRFESAVQASSGRAGSVLVVLLCRRAVPGKIGGVVASGRAVLGTAVVLLLCHLW
jgi:hypothetical protein